jgi:rhamnosyltransferase
MRRVALFAHFDPQNQIKRHVVDYLSKLKAECDRIVFVSTSPLPSEEQEKVLRFASEVLLKENTGFDFGMWRYALDRIEWQDSDEIVLVNSSVLGPVFPLRPIFDRMANEVCDCWGMTDCEEVTWHLQSYFLVLRRPVITSPHFTKFWETVLPLRHKGQVILSYEIGLTTYFQGEGFKPGVFASVSEWATAAVRRQMRRTRNFNPTLFHPLELLAAGMPFVKASLLKENVGRLPLEPVFDAMRATGYDMSLVEIQPHPPSPLTWRDVARRTVPNFIVDGLLSLVERER